MNPNKVVRKIGVGALLIGAGYFGGKYVHTPQRAWNIDNHNEGEDIVIENRVGQRAILYGISDSGAKLKDFVSGEEASEIFNARWRQEYIKRWKEEPKYDKFHLKTEWKRW